MKFICEGEDLKAAVAIVAHGTNPKSLNPILEGIKIMAEKDTVTLFATDLELYLRKTIRADVKQDGQAVLPGKLFAEYIGKIGNGPVTFTSVDTAAVIQHGDGNDGNFSCLPAEEFPDLLNLNAQPSFSIKAGNLREIITKTLPFTARDEARPVLRGTLFDVDAKNNTVTAVALDGFRLSRVTKPVIKPAQTMKVIIPNSALDQMRRILTDDKEEINLIVENKFVQLAIGSTTMASRLIDGDFVNYKQVIPAESTCNAVVETAQLMTAVGRAGLLQGGNKTNIVKISFGAKHLELNAYNEMGKINERVPANWNGQDLVIGLNAKFLFDALNSISDEFINLAFSTPLSPCVITSAKTGDYLFLILPVHL